MHMVRHIYTTDNWQSGTSSVELKKRIKENKTS